MLPALRGLNRSSMTFRENQTSHGWCLSKASPVAPIVMMVVADLRDTGPVGTSLSLPGLNGERDGACQQSALSSKPPICSSVTSPPGPTCQPPLPSQPPPPRAACASPTCAVLPPVSRCGDHTQDPVTVSHDSQRAV